MNTTEIQKYLQEHKIYAEVGENNEDEIVVYIEWGDWKHDHLYCIKLLEEQGYKHLWEEVEEDDGSDTYSAYHDFEKPENANSTLQNEEKCV